MFCYASKEYYDGKDHQPMKESFIGVIERNHLIGRKIPSYYFDNYKNVIAYSTPLDEDEIQKYDLTFIGEFILGQWKGRKKICHR